ncbi:transcription initiation factor TFIID subunit 7-like isoform X1 [Chenopodium quinoa]|uniref:transcription initiation factor TFIID subunit 7-like isoform X1 n=1 Tax=Chenopodium quinoa TaxID=63459 RepID=UPI000B787DA5|nr:transcription initiation factor TFIID subunit 7-like isoform X1 [Chenopodium quinoa]
MEEQFILRVPPSIAERIEQLLNEDPSSSEDKSLDLSFTEDGRSGTFMIGDERFPASLLDLPCVTESYKTYDDSVLIKTADIGQMILVREGNDNPPDTVEYRHGLTPPMRDARRRRFRREPDLNVYTLFCSQRLFSVLRMIFATLCEAEVLKHLSRMKMLMKMYAMLARNLLLLLKPSLIPQILLTMLARLKEVTQMSLMSRVSENLHKLQACRFLDCLATLPPTKY